METTHDLIVIGGGSAGLTASGIAAGVGAKTALVEAERLGGDCTWTGCVPSKTLLHAAHVAHQSATASRAGLTDTPVDVDFAGLMRHVRALREHVYDEADAPRVVEATGVEVVPGRARFLDPHTVEITRESGETERISGRKILIATGGRPRVPDIPGLDGLPFVTSETLFEITEQPRHLVVLGAGPIGIEMAQAFRRLGSDVTVIDRGDRILSKDDPDLARMLQSVLEAEGVRFCFGADVERAERDGAGAALMLGTGERIAADLLLVATGRMPNTETLELDAAGVAHTQTGITVDKAGRTSVRHIYAAGDVTGQFALTHMSEHTAKVAVTNAVLHVPASIDVQHVPWATYTSPELAHVGAGPDDLDRAGTAYTTFRFPYSKLDRAITEGETTGEIRIHATRWGRILGADVLGARAGDLVGEIAVAMRAGVSMNALSSTIHPYPTYSLGVRRAADQWIVGLRTERVVRAARWIFGYRGPVIPHVPGEVV